MKMLKECDLEVVRTYRVYAVVDEEDEATNDEIAETAAAHFEEIAEEERVLSPDDNPEVTSVIIKDVYLN